MSINLSYEDPLRAVFLRKLAWELYVLKKDVTIMDIESRYLQDARAELGLKKLRGGARNVFIQDLRKDGYIHRKDRRHVEPTDPAWQNEWRVQHLPSHQIVRHLSGDPIIMDLHKSEKYLHFDFIPRDPVFSAVSVYVASVEKLKILTNERANIRGIYIIGKSTNNLYIGQTDEPQVRLPNHKQNMDWAVYIALKDDPALLTRDSLYAAESLMISFWNEIAYIENDKRGGDTKPPWKYLQQAIIFTEAASAALLWLERNFKLISIPLKICRAHGWEDGKSYKIPPTLNNQIRKS